jgi:hypothetical protein
MTATCQANRVTPARPAGGCAPAAAAVVEIGAESPLPGSPAIDGESPAFNVDIARLIPVAIDSDDSAKKVILGRSPRPSR